MQHPTTPSARSGLRGYRRVGERLAAVLAPVAALLVLRLLFGVASRSWPAGGPSSAPATVDEVVLGLLSWAAALLCAWLSISVTLTAATRLPGRLGRAFETVARVVTPAVLRRSIAMLLGVSVSTLALPAGPASGAGRQGLAVAASARLDSGEASQTGRSAGPGLHPTSPESTTATTPLSPAWRVTRQDQSTSPRPGTPGLVGPGLRVTEATPSNETAGNNGPGWRPTAPLRVAEQPTLLTPALRADSASMDHVTVRRGDSLWSIAGRHLGPSATDAEIAHEWPRWYAANAELIGDDPDLIHPGQQLLPPHQKVLR